MSTLPLNPRRVRGQVISTPRRAPARYRDRGRPHAPATSPPQKATRRFYVANPSPWTPNSGQGNFADDGSTWEYRAPTPMPPPPPPPPKSPRMYQRFKVLCTGGGGASSGESSETVVTAQYTPQLTAAQAFAAQYRQQPRWMQPRRMDRSSSSGSSSTQVGRSRYVSVDVSSVLGRVPENIYETTSPAMRWRQSRDVSLPYLRREAKQMAIRSGRADGFTDIPCSRPGCVQVLPDYRALVAHLELHSIGDAQDWQGGIQFWTPKGIGYARRRYRSPPARRKHRRTDRFKDFLRNLSAYFRRRTQKY